MKKFIFLCMFLMNFVAVNAVLKLDLSSTIKNTFFQREVSLWMGIMSASIFALFTIEVVKNFDKIMKKRKVESKHLIDSYA